MSKELMAEPFIFMGPINESRDIGNGNATIVRKIHDSNNWMKCCKWIRRCFWMSGRDFSEER